MHPSLNGFLTTLKQDVATYARAQGKSTMLGIATMVLSTPPLWALAVYRLGRFAMTLRAPAARVPTKCIYVLAHHIVTRVSKVWLPLGAHIHENVWIGPVGHIIVAPGTTLGPGCRLYGGNTLGIGGRPGMRGVPKLGARVYLAPGAAVVGPVALGDNVVVTANSLVSRSCEHAAVLQGLPAQAIQEQPSTHLPRLH
jgi:serine acetyltransferase